MVDGTGSSRAAADVGLTGNRVAWIGETGAATAPDTIDASGLVVAPGFIDVHSHTSPQIAEEEFKLNEGETWDEMLELLRLGLDLDHIVTHQMPLSSFEDGIALLDRGEAHKVVLDPSAV